jgi:hypothetical protein
MRAPQKTLAALLTLLLAATLWGLWSTGQERATVQGVKAAAADTPANPVPVIDENTLFTAHRLARLATTPEEQPYAQAAVQLADHELDLAFSGALRRLEAHPPVLSPQALQFQQRLTEAQKQVTADTEALARLRPNRNGRSPRAAAAAARCRPRRASRYVPPSVAWRSPCVT